MRKVSFFIIFFQMLTVPLFAGGWYSVNIDLKTTAAMTAAYAAETATEMMNDEDVQKILDHYTNAEVSTAGIFASKWLDRKALQNAGLFGDAEENSASTLVNEKAGYARKESKDTTVYQHPIKIKVTEHIVLNTADTTSLITIPGIGPYYARKIVQYGNRLGGYVSVDQLDEIDDFPTEAKKYLVVSNPSPKKLNVNQLSLNELKRHPYINFYQAKAITDYRRLHGAIKSLNELRLIKDFSPEAIKRLIPYVAY